MLPLLICRRAIRTPHAVQLAIHPSGYASVRLSVCPAIRLLHPPSPPRSASRLFISLRPDPRLGLVCPSGADHSLLRGRNHRLRAAERLQTWCSGLDISPVRRPPPPPPAAVCPPPVAAGRRRSPPVARLLGRPRSTAAEAQRRVVARGGFCRSLVRVSVAYIRPLFSCCLAAALYPLYPEPGEAGGRCGPARRVHRGECRPEPDGAWL